MTPYPSTDQSVEGVTLTTILTPLVTMISDFPPVQPTPGSRGGSWVFEHLFSYNSKHGSLPKNKPSLFWLTTPVLVLLGFDACRQMDPFSSVTDVCEKVQEPEEE